MLKGNKELAVDTIAQECSKIVRSVYSGQHLVTFASPMYDKLNSEISLISNKIGSAIINCELIPTDDSGVSGILNKKTASDTAQMYVGEFFEKISPGNIGRKRSIAFKTQFKYSLDKISKQWKEAGKKRSK